MSRELMETESRGTLAARLENARATTDEIFRLLEPESLYERPIAERHRTIGPRRRATGTTASSRTTVTESVSPACGCGSARVMVAARRGTGPL